MPTKLSNKTEHSEQVALIQWAAAQYGKHPELQWLFAIPNGAKLPYVKNKKGARYSPQALSLLAEGLRPGVADLMLPVARGGFNALFLEMKLKPNKVSEQQHAFLDFVRTQGYAAVVAWSFEQARDYILHYLNLR